MRVLGIDPGYAIVGWGVVDYAGNRFAPVDFGAVCTEAGLPIYEYTPMQVKQAVTGYGKAVKKQVQEMTRMMLNLPSVPKPDDTADALAMAITFCHTNGNQLNRFVRRVAGPI